MTDSTSTAANDPIVATAIAKNTTMTACAAGSKRLSPRRQCKNSSSKDNDDTDKSPLKKLAVEVTNKDGTTSIKAVDLVVQTNPTVPIVEADETTKENDADMITSITAAAVTANTQEVITITDDTEADATMLSTDDAPEDEKAADVVDETTKTTAPVVITIAIPEEPSISTNDNEKAASPITVVVKEKLDAIAAAAATTTATAADDGKKEDSTTSTDDVVAAAIEDAAPVVTTSAPDEATTIATSQDAAPTNTTQDEVAVENPSTTTQDEPLVAATQDKEVNTQDEAPVIATQGEAFQDKITVTPDSAKETVTADGVVAATTDVVQEDAAEIKVAAASIEVA